MEQAVSDLFEQFSSALIKTLKPNRTFVLTAPDNLGSRDFIPDIFATLPSDFQKNFLELNFDEGEFDLIAGAIPLGWRAAQIGETKFQTSNASFEIILKLSESLTNCGHGIFLMGPLGFGGTQGEQFLNRMNEQGIFVHSYINLPENILQPTTSIRPILVVTSKQNVELQICSLNIDSDVLGLVSDLFEANSGSKFIDKLEHKTFSGFPSFEIRKRIGRLETRYKDFKAVRFDELVESCSLGRNSKPFEELPNAIYLKVLGNNENLITSVSDISGRIENFLQIQLNETVSNHYLKIFFRSDLGKLVLQSVINSSYLPRLNRQLLFDTEIPVPDIATQNHIVETALRLSRLEKQLDQFKNQISLNPLSPHILSKIDSMLDISDELTAEDKIKSIVLQGESETVEFKQTFQHCLRSEKRENYIETAAFKTIVAFLNTKGGSLLIGVADNGLIPGVDYEIKNYHKNSSDKFLLHVKDKLKSRIGTNIFNFIEISLVNVDGYQVLSISCLPSDLEVFLDNKDFYVRTSPATEKLEGRDFSNYVRNRFFN